jgi:pilus assembly protein CpaF
MSLTDRLAQRYSTGGDSGRSNRTTMPVPASGSGSAAALRLRVHRELLAILGPQLYDNRTADAVLEQKVRDTIDEVLARDEPPNCSTKSSGTDRSSRCCVTRMSPKSW